MPQTTPEPLSPSDSFQGRGRGVRTLQPLWETVKVVNLYLNRDGSLKSRIKDQIVRGGIKTPEKV